MSFWKFFDKFQSKPASGSSRLRPACTFDPMDSGDESAGLVLNGYYLPEEILRIILSFVDAKSLLQCRRVCKYWKFEVDNEVWKYKVRQEQCLSSSSVNTLANAVPNAWLEFYFISLKNPFGKNLIQNNCGQDKLKHWEVLTTGGDHWLIENPPIGLDTDDLPDDVNVMKKNFCFVTSYHSCSKQQVIDLRKAGPFSSQLMDTLKPIISVSDWYAGRWDCGCVYELKVTLYDTNMEVIKEFEYRKTMAAGEGVVWQKVSHEFSDYESGVRYVSFYHGGTDTQFWRGHYGSKMTGACVKIYLRTEMTSNATKPSITEPSNN